MGNNLSQIGRNGSNTIFKIGIKELAVLSICVYIICTIIFEYAKVSVPMISSLSLYLCLGFCTLDCISKRHLKWFWFFTAFSVLGLVMAVSAFVSPADTGLVISTLYRYWSSLVLVVLVCNVISEFKHIEVILKSFVMGCIGLSVYIYSYYGFQNLLQSGERLEDGFGNVNAIGLNCVFAVFISVFGMVALKWNKLFGILSCVICIPCILFTGSRKALISLVICFIVFIFTYLRNLGILKKLLIALVVLAVIWFLINNLPIFEVVRTRLDGMFQMAQGGDGEGIGDENRVLYITSGLELFFNKPIFGHGLSYSYFIFGTYTHNNFVEMLLCHGIIGFACYYFVFAKLAIKSFSLYKNRVIFSFIWVFLIKQLFEDIGVVTYYNRMNLLLIGIVAVWIMLERKNQRMYDLK